jgi:hypothetical protein
MESFHFTRLYNHQYPLHQEHSSEVLADQTISADDVVHSQELLHHENQIHHHSFQFSFQKLVNFLQLHKNHMVSLLQR